MSLSIRDLILANVPEDGSAIGNMALVALLRETVPELTDEEYTAAKDGLVAEGLLGKGRGRGGSVFLLGFEDDDEYEEAGDDFALTAQEAAAPSAPKAVSGKRKVARKADGPTQVLSYRHTETRVNNPEVGMVHPDNDPDQPKTVWKYDPHLDPELMFDSQRGAVERLIDDALVSGDADAMRDALVELKRLQEPYLNWAGKAEGTSFAVDTVSLHVHERVDPATILANARKRLKGEKPVEAWRQADLFAAPFENLPLRQALDFYHHEKGWSNRLIAGDSLLVMNSLLHKESMAGKVQMIYLDPPYGIKYKSNFQPFTNKRDVSDSDKDDDLNQEPEMIKAFRDTWELGIHSYLTYLRDRLLLAKELLHESGSVFVQISDENVHRVRSVMDEIFGPSNFVGLIWFRKKTMPLGAKHLERMGDYIVWFSKDISRLKFNRLYATLDYTGDSHWNWREVDGRRQKFGKAEIEANPPGEPLRLVSMWPPSFSPKDVYAFPFMGRGWEPAQGSCYPTNPGRLARVAKAGRLEVEGQYLRYVMRASDDNTTKINLTWHDTVGARDQNYVVETAEKVIERCLLMTTDPGDLVLDPTCGSGTSAYVAEKCGRRWITCDTSRVALTLARKRLMTASFDYFRLRYPHEGLKGGFIYQTTPKVSLPTIADNADIDTIYEAMFPAIAAALETLNTALLSNPPQPFKPVQGYRKGKSITFASGDRLEPPRDCRRP